MGRPSKIELENRRLNEHVNELYRRIDEIGAERNTLQAANEKLARQVARRSDQMLAVLTILNAVLDADPVSRKTALPIVISAQQVYALTRQIAGT